MNNSRKSHIRSIECRMESCMRVVPELAFVCFFRNFYSHKIYFKKETMAKVEKGKFARKQKRDEVFPLEKENFIIIGIGLLAIVLGYVALSGNTVGGFRQLTLSPILLLLGYCVIIPIGIMYRKKEKHNGQTPGEGQVQ